MSRGWRTPSGIYQARESGSSRGAWRRSNAPDDAISSCEATGPRASKRLVAPRLRASLRDGLRYLHVRRIDRDEEIVPRRLYYLDAIPVRAEERDDVGRRRRHLLALPEG